MADQAPDLLLTCSCGNQTALAFGAFDVLIFGLLQWRCQRCGQVHTDAPGQPWGLPEVEHVRVGPQAANQLPRSTVL